MVHCQEATLKLSKCQESFILPRVLCQKGLSTALVYPQILLVEDTGFPNSAETEVVNTVPSACLDLVVV